VNGPRTIRAFWELGALDRLELVVLPMLLGEGLPLSPQGAPPAPLTLLRSDRTFPDGSAELVYTPA
jgi:dihydrofolate reductase